MKGKKPKEGRSRVRAQDPMSKWLRTVRTIAGLEQTEFAKYIGKSRSAVAMYETGTPVPLDVVATIIETFPLSPPPPVGNEVRVLGPATSMKKEFRLPYAGSVPASSWGAPLAGEDTRLVDSRFYGEKRFICTIQGDCCYPALQPGDSSIWEVDPSPAYGSIVLAERTADHACTVKELVYDDEAKRPVLRPINLAAGTIDPLDGFQVKARLVAVIRDADGIERTWFLATGLRARHLT